jgi:3-oxoacyl-[acyl-carrier-protein] synthase III
LNAEQIALQDITKIFPPQISPAFTERLSNALGVPFSSFVTVSGDSADLYSSSVPVTLAQALDTHAVAPGDTGLFITVGSGVQVGMALYYF